MIDQSKYRFYTFFLIGLTALSVILFLYTNLFGGKVQMESYTTVYLSRDTINAFETIQASQFEPVSIPSKGVLSGAITDIAQVEGQYTKHQIQAGELLMTSQLTTENLNAEGSLVIPLEGAYISDIRPGDHVSVYVLRIITNKGESSTIQVDRVFSSKKLYRDGRNSTAALIEDTQSVGRYIKVTEEELNAYYQAYKSGEVIIAKQSEDISAIIDTFGSNHIEEYEPDSQIQPFDPQGVTEKDETTPTIETPQSSANSSADETDANQTTVLYTVGEDETWATISLKFKTPVETLYNLNPDVTNIEAGIELIVPAL